jgi:hypothetical protein
MYNEVISLFALAKIAGGAIVECPKNVQKWMKNLEGYLSLEQINSKFEKEVRKLELMKK